MRGLTTLEDNIGGTDCKCGSGLACGCGRSRGRHNSNVNANSVSPNIIVNFGAQGVPFTPTPVPSLPVTRQAPQRAAGVVSTTPMPRSLSRTAHVAPIHHSKPDVPAFLGPKHKVYPGFRDPF